MAITKLGVVEEPVGLQAAKFVVGLGGHVIPAFVNRYGEKIPLVKEWNRVATRDHGELETFWQRYSYAWPGVVSRPDGLIVFDLDGLGAVNWFRELSLAHGGVGEGCWIVRTPGRDTGCHIWYRWPGYLEPFHKAEVRGGDGWTGGAELRGANCWSLWAGARRPDGEYELLQTPEALEEAPEELVAAFLGEAEQSLGGCGPGDLREISPNDAWAGAPYYDGRRNLVAALCWYLAIRSAGESESYWETVRRFNDECCSPPLEWGIVERKAAYTWTRAVAAREKLAKEAEGYQKLIGKLFA